MANDKGSIKNASIDVSRGRTDDEAVEFYKKIGFQVKSLGEKYPGVERFCCYLKCSIKIYKYTSYV